MGYSLPICRRYGMVLKISFGLSGEQRLPSKLCSAVEKNEGCLHSYLYTHYSYFPILLSLWQDGQDNVPTS
uniref:Uncharacterized protein n=1 Tax=Anguilla anguilla TaxID=7936 RepID=A0A0E9WCA9_ANGAN